MPDQIVAVGFLTQRDLDSLGARLDHIYRFEPGDEQFDDLLALLDQVERTPAKPTPAN